MAVVNPDRDTHLRSHRSRPEDESRSAPTPTPGPTASPPRIVRRVRPRRSLWGIPLAAVVGVEMVLTAGWLVPGATGAAAYLALGLATVVGLGLVIPTRAGSLAMAVTRRVGFVGRATVATVPPGARDIGADAPTALVPLRAVFPGLGLRIARDHQGGPFAVAEWAQGATVVIAVSGASGPLVHPTGATRLPLGALHEAVAARGIPVDAVGIHSVATGSGSGLGHRVVYVTLRVRPLDARAAIAERGGGATGLDACLAALISVAESTLHAAGLTADALDMEPAAAALWSVLEPAMAGSPADAAATWVESWSDVTGPTASHRTAAASAWDPTGSLDALWTGAGLGRVVTTEVAPRPDGTAQVRLVSRVTEPGVRATAEAAVRTSRAAAAAGLALRPTHGEQAAGLRASSLLGEGTAPVSPLDARPGSALAGRLVVPAALLDAMSPAIGTGVALGDDEGGTPVSLDLVGPRPQRLLAVGQGWLATELAARAAEAGVRVAVVTDRPAPWLATARGSGVADLVHVVGDPRGLDATELGRGPLLVIVEGAASAPAILGRAAWQSILHVLPRVDAVPPGLAEGADLVLLAAGAGEDPAGLGVALAVPAEVAARAVQLAGTDVIAWSRGLVVGVRLVTGAGSAPPEPVNTLVR